MHLANPTELANIAQETSTEILRGCWQLGDLAHKVLDHAVLDAYGWPYDLTDEEILERLLALNLERAAICFCHMIDGGTDQWNPRSDYASILT